jgi:hypothetical protein
MLNYQEELGMNNHDSSREVNETERIMALLALTIRSQEVNRGECLSDEQLVAFINRELGRKQRQQVLAHLNSCQACYHLWLETASYSQSFEPVKPSDWLTPFYARLLTIRQYLLDSWKLAVPVAVVTMLAMAMLWRPLMVATIGEQIDAGYAQLRNSSLPKDFHFPGGGALGFSPFSVSTEALAFKAGIWTGEATLREETIRLPNSLNPPSGVSSWSSSQWADEYELGRWVALLWVNVTQEVERSPTFWQQQSAVAEILRNRFAQRSSTEIVEEAMTTLKTIQPWLLQLQQQPKHDIYSELRTHLERAIIKLSP